MNPSISHLETNPSGDNMTVNNFNFMSYVPPPSYHSNSSLNSIENSTLETQRQLIDRYKSFMAINPFQQCQHPSPINKENEKNYSFKSTTTSTNKEKRKTTRLLKWLSDPCQENEVRTSTNNSNETKINLPLRSNDYDLAPLAEMSKRFGHLNLSCVFCRKNGERPEIYKSHCLKSRDGKVIQCPILRSYTCPLCGETGNGAHTKSYCPLKK
ncbi:hypothetical protein SNEBB_002416 [Seison nebaliae]|nr:hypothetical protein SNEBB_002416 [Seison nebaliae]